jgi:hypothetical protein
MRGDRLVLILTLAGVVGCESGWDIRGQVLTAGVSDRARPLLIYLLDEPAIEPGKLPAGARPHGPLARAATVPSEGLTFELQEFGCHRGAVMVVAWVPSAGPAAPVGAPLPFEPKAGDLVAFSDVRKP